MMKLEFHEIADLFPLLEGKDYEVFKEDVSRRGQDVPIWIHEGKILDGRNRYRACLDLGIEPKTQQWEGPGSPIDFVLAMNLHRRHLTESQRAMIGARIKQLYEIEARNRQEAGLKQNRNSLPDNGPSVSANLRSRTPGKSSQKASTSVKVSPRSVEMAGKVVSHGLPELIKLVESDQVSVSAAAMVASLPRKEQVALVAAGPKAIRKKAAEIRKGTRGKPLYPSNGDGVPAGDPSDHPGPEAPPRPAGKSRVNGELVDDPPDIAAQRAAGKLAPDVVPEISEPTPEAEGEPRAESAEEAAEEDIDDTAWLESLPLRTALDGAPRRWFEADALLYRTLEPARATFARVARKALATARRKGGNGEYAFRLSSFIRLDHPKHWKICPSTEHGGCGGTGTLELIGQCPRCRGRGYWIR